MTGGPIVAAPHERVREEVRREFDELMAYISGRRRTFTDWFLVALTWVSLGTNGWLLFAEPRGRDWHDALQLIDVAVTSLLGLSICWRWLRFRIGWVYLRRHWWEVPALIPVTAAGADGHHWLLWVVLLARIVRTVDRTDNVVGDRITAALVQHFMDPIVDAVRRPITVAVLDEVIAVIETGTYAANVRAALDENRIELEAMVLDLVRRDPTTGKLRYVPFHDEIVQMVADTVLRIVDGALDDPRTTELISDVIRNSAAQLRQAVRRRGA